MFHARPKSVQSGHLVGPSVGQGISNAQLGGIDAAANTGLSVRARPTRGF